MKACAIRALRSSNSDHVRELSACVMATWSGIASAIDSHTVAKCISIGQIVGHGAVPIVTQRIVASGTSRVGLLAQAGRMRRRTPVMGATSWQHIRTFSGDVERTLEQLRSDVFSSGAFYFGDEPVLVGAGERGTIVNRAARPATIADALEWNGDEGSHSVLDITEGIATRPTWAAMSPLAPELAERCFGNARPSLFEVLMSDFDAADVCGPGSGRYFVIAEPGQPALVVFVGCTGS